MKNKNYKTKRKTRRGIKNKNKNNNTKKGGQWRDKARKTLLTFARALKNPNLGVKTVPAVISSVLNKGAKKFPQEYLTKSVQDELNKDKKGSKFSELPLSELPLKNLKGYPDIKDMNEKELYKYIKELVDTDPDINTTFRNGKTQPKTTPDIKHMNPQQLYKYIKDLVDSDPDINITLRNEKTQPEREIDNSTLALMTNQEMSGMESLIPFLYKIKRTEKPEKPEKTPPSVNKPTIPIENMNSLSKTVSNTKVDVTEFMSKKMQTPTGWIQPTRQLFTNILIGQQLFKHKNGLMEEMEAYNKITDPTSKKLKKLILIDKLEQIKKLDLNKNEDEKLNVTYDEIKQQFVYEKPYKFERQCTFTYNLVNNLNISYTEIYNGYCETTTRCTKVKSVTVFNVISVMIDNFMSTLEDHTIEEQHPDLPDAARNSYVTRVKVPWGINWLIGNEITIGNITPFDGIGVNYTSLIYYLKACITNKWDKHWINDIAGFLIPSITEIFKDIENSKTNKLDILLLIGSAITQIPELEFEKTIQDNLPFKTLKNDIEDFLIKYSPLFSKEYEKTQFMSFSEEAKQKIATEAKELSKKFVDDYKQHIKYRFQITILKYIIDDYWHKNYNSTTEYAYKSKTEYASEEDYVNYLFYVCDKIMKDEKKMEETD